MELAELNDTNFTEQLVLEIPEFRGVYETHQAYYDEALPYVLLDDFAKFLYQNFAAFNHEPTDIDALDIITRILDFIEKAMGSPNLEVQNLSASFVESLQPSSDEELSAYNAIQTLIGPRLKEAVRRWA